MSKSQSEVKSLQITAIKVMDVIEFGQLDTESLETNFAPILLDFLVYVKQLKMTSNSFQSRHKKGEKVEEASDALVISAERPGTSFTQQFRPFNEILKLPNTPDLRRV